MEIPKLNFSKWCKWENRNDIYNIEYPGIYAIAITSKNLSDKNIDYANIVYIGMSNSQKGLKGRLNQFNNSIHGKYGHSGGKSVYQKLGDYKKWDKKLFVATMPIECDTNKESQSHDDLRKMGIVACLEYMAFARFKLLTEEHKPEYNTQ